MRIFALSENDYYYTRNDKFVHFLFGVEYHFTSDSSYTVAISKLLARGLIFQIDGRTINAQKEVNLYFAARRSES